VYTIYFQTAEDVTPLRYCNGYSHAEELFESVCVDFMKVYYTGVPHKLVDSHKEKVDVVAFPAALYADKVFNKGLVFLKKKHDFLVYEKVCNTGTFMNSYVVNYLGRIGVMAQTYKLSDAHQATLDQQKSMIDTLQNACVQKDSMLAHQAKMIGRMDAEMEAFNDALRDKILQIDTLTSALQKAKDELTQANSEIEQHKLIQEVDILVEPLVAPRIPRITELSMKNNAITPVLEELKAKFEGGITLRSKKAHPKIKKTDDDLELDRMLALLDEITLKEKTE
jgi:hypothetical protein